MIDHKTSIMVVDDDPSIRILLKRTLENDYAVITADDGNSALQLLEDTSPELIILDYSMPGLNGVQVLDRIRKTSEIPVIMLTAKREVETLYSAFSVGADDYVIKPFGKYEFIARVKALLRRNQKQSDSEGKI